MPTEIRQAHVPGYRAEPAFRKSPSWPGPAIAPNPARYSNRLRGDSLFPRNDFACSWAGIDLPEPAVPRLHTNRKPFPPLLLNLKTDQFEINKAHELTGGKLPTFIMDKLRSAAEPGRALFAG